MGIKSLLSFGQARDKPVRNYSNGEYSFNFGRSTSGKSVNEQSNIIIMIPSFVIRVIYMLLMKFRLMGVFLWFVGLSIIYWNDETREKYSAIVPYYGLLGIVVLIGTIIAMVTAVIRIWKPGFQFLDLFTGTPEHMDIRYFQTVTSLRKLDEEWLDKSLKYNMQKDTYGTSWKEQKEYRRMRREYEYLKKKFEMQAEQV